MENLELLKISNENELKTVENNLITITNNELNILKAEEQLKELKLHNDNLKKYIFDKMKEYDIKSLETPSFKITRIDETTRVTLDSKRIKEEEPLLYEKYSKVSKVKGYVKLTKKKEEVM